MIQRCYRIARLAATRLLALVVAAGLVAGCKSPLPQSWKTDDVEPQRELRKQEVIEQFENKRNKAELAAAQDRFKLGDVEGCREALQAILKRQPQHTEARQLLAQLDRMEQPPAAGVATAEWTDAAAEVVNPQVASVSAALPIKPLAPAQQPASSSANRANTLTNDEMSSYIGGTDHAAASLCLGPAGAAHGGRRLPIYQTDLTRYKGSTRSEVARRSVTQAAESLAVGDADQARLYYRAAASAEPDNADLLLAASVMALRYDQDALAMELAQSAISVQPGQAAPYRTLAAICYRNGDYHGSYEALSRAISLDKAHPLSYFLMGSTLRKLGENDKADWHFQQAAQLDPSYAVRR